MNFPSTHSDVSDTAIPRTRGAVSAKNLSWSLASENLVRLKAGVSPLTMTGFGGPISRTSFFSSAILFPQKSAVDPRQHDAHEHHADGVVDDLLDHEIERERHDGIVDEIERKHRQHGNGHAVADALGEPRLLLLALEVDPAEAERDAEMGEQHVRHLRLHVGRRAHQVGKPGVVAVQQEAMDEEPKPPRQNEHHND